MKTEVPFAPYQGSEDYIFVSYAHKDSARVFEVIRELHQRRYRVWYDQGIEIGADWPQVVAEKLQRSALVLVFISENALRSQNCRREIHYAVSQKKNMLVVRLDESVLPEDLAMQLSVVEELRFTGGASTAEALTEKLSDALIGDGVTGYEEQGKRGGRRRNVWLIVSVVTSALLLCAVVYVVLGMSGKLAGAGIVRETLPQDTAEGTPESGPVSVTRFQDALSMEILLNSLDSSYIHICGNCIVSDAAAIVRTGSGWEIGGETVARGSIRKTDYFTDKPIVQLSLVNENLKSADGLEQLTQLTYLDLSDNPLTDLSALRGHPAIQTVKLLGVPAETDLAPLADIPGLKTVYVSYDMVGGIGSLVDAGVDVIVRR
jgi:hypothetical protein